ncbi:MAG: aspartate carbamoyltransferase catalytic subunit [Culicoidibacterales bacterium]
MKNKNLFTIDVLTVAEINTILFDAHLFSTIYRDWQFPDDRRVANLFFEPSTRTQYSFESAQHQLNCKITTFNAETSSVQKGETLYDTVKTFEAIGMEALVIRHPENEYFKQLEDKINIPILNGGDGSGNHPTQCLLDLMTIQEEFGHFEGLKVAIVGDIQHSRVASSNLQAMEKLGMTTYVSGPKEWSKNLANYRELENIIAEVDVLMLLRIQHERHEATMQLTKDQYLQAYGLTQERMKQMKASAIVMHPAPFNRGVEIDSDLVEHRQSRIFKQMENGVHVRKAVLKRAFGYEFPNSEQ